mmetsp:Transcript_48452/g.125720  ORF Transcript_48452/g.125720 Transcript_48452/m.125720 type:complete len:267 (-) Transcript_48452:498-1298(-)
MQERTYGIICKQIPQLLPRHGARAVFVRLDEPLHHLLYHSDLLMIGSIHGQLLVRLGRVDGGIYENTIQNVQDAEHCEHNEQHEKPRVERAQTQQHARHVPPVYSTSDARQKREKSCRTRSKKLNQRGPRIRIAPIIPKNPRLQPLHEHDAKYKYDNRQKKYGGQECVCTPGNGVAQSLQGVEDLRLGCSQAPHHPGEAHHFQEVDAKAIRGPEQVQQDRHDRGEHCEAVECVPPPLTSCKKLDLVGENPEGQLEEEHERECNVPR